MIRFLLLLAFCLNFPLALGAQNNFDWALIGDTIEETEGRGLVVRSNPSGARVYIDGIERGRTPLRQENIRAGTYFVRVEKEGYVDRRFGVSVRPGSVMNVSLELQPAVGRVLLKIQAGGTAPGSTANGSTPSDSTAPDSTPPGSPDQALPPLAPRISVDGQSYPSTALELPVGFRTILVRAFGWENNSETLYVGEDSFRELEISLNPAPFSLSGASLSRTRFNPANAGSLGTTTFGFEVSAPGTGTFTVLDREGKTVLARSLEPFETWSQHAMWNGKDNNGDLVPDGVYTLIVKANSLPLDNSPPKEESLVLEVKLDSSKVIHPLTLSSAKSGLFYAPVPSVLPRGSFQIEGSLLAGSPAGPGSESDGPWTSLPFSAAFRVSALDRLELSAALNAIPSFKGDTGAGIGGGAKWVFRDSNEGGLPLGAAAGAVFSWTGKTGLTPFGMASGIEFYFPFNLDLGRLFSFVLCPAGLWTGDEGFPWEPAPRLLVSGGLLMKLSYVSAGLSVRNEFNFTGDSRPYIIAGGEVKIFPPPSSFVFSVMGGVWVRDGNAGGFAGLGIGMIH